MSGEGPDLVPGPCRRDHAANAPSCRLGRKRRSTAGIADDTVPEGIAEDDVWAVITRVSEDPRRVVRTATTAAETATRAVAGHFIPGARLAGVIARHAPTARTIRRRTTRLPSWTARTCPPTVHVALRPV